MTSFRKEEWYTILIFFCLASKPYHFTQSSLHRKLCTRLLKCFILEHSVFKTKHLRSLVQSFERRLNWADLARSCHLSDSNATFNCFTCKQKYSRLRCLLHVKGLVICFYLDWSCSILQFRQNIIKVELKSWLLTCSRNITLSLPSYTGSALMRVLNFCNGYLSVLYFCV